MPEHRSSIHDLLMCDPAGGMREDGWATAERIQTCERRATALVHAATAGELAR